jgi:hypothetical protein
LEAHQRWLLLDEIGLQNAILGPHFIPDAFLGLEALGPSEVQDLWLVGPSKPGLDGG